MNYIVQSGDTLSTIAAGLAAAVTADANLQTIGVNATSSSNSLYLKSVSSNITTYAYSVSGGATETIAPSVYGNGTEFAVVGGSKTAGDVLTLTVWNSALTGGKEAVSYTVLSTDTLTSIATGLKNAINADSSLSGIGVTATSASAVVSITSSSANATTYSQAMNTHPSETLTLGANLNPAQLALIGGSKTTSDVLSISVVEPGLRSGRTISHPSSNSQRTNSKSGELVAGQYSWVSTRKSCHQSSFVPNCS